ncbi:hypothetical protein JQ035_15655 [Clostridium botulinum]|nr:hypothetical protein [Clostridium botulinum]
MVINKILNNNAVITFDDKGKEIIIMGKGIAYGKRKGDFIEESKLPKIYFKFYGIFQSSC